MIEPTLSATVVRGKKTNRVKQVKPHGKRGRPPGKTGRKRETSVQRALLQPGSNTYVIVSVSLYSEDLSAMDELAARVHMTRSALIRRAVKFFEAHIDGNSEQANRWKEAMR